MTAAAEPLAGLGGGKRLGVRRGRGVGGEGDVGGRGLKRRRVNGTCVKNQRGLI